jgi:hypothetical protein
MNDDNLERKIVDYVNGQMDAAEQPDFERQMAENEELEREVNFYREVAQTTRKMEDQELRRLISATDHELAGEGFFEAQPSAKMRRLNPLRIAIAIAASVLVLAAAGWWYANSNYSNQALADRHFDAQVTQQMVRSESGTEGLLSPGLQALSSGQWEEAILFFETIPESSGQYLESRLYLALAHYQSKDFKAALDIADEVRTSTSRFQQKARWLQLSSLLQLNETGDTFHLLLDDATTDNTDPYYQKMAKELEREMGSFWRKIVD